MKRKHTPSAKRNAGLKRSWLKRGPQTVEDYIKSKIVKVGGCHLWKAAKEGKYGWFEFKKNAGAAHKKVYEALVGPVPKGKCVLHTCDDQRCVKLRHLYLGDRKDNRRDFMERHPRAKQITETLIANGRKAVLSFWKNMSPKQKKEFCKKRAKIQASKYPLGPRNGKEHARLDSGL